MFGFFSSIRLIIIGVVVVALLGGIFALKHYKAKADRLALENQALTKINTETTEIAKDDAKAKEVLRGFTNEQLAEFMRTGVLPRPGVPSPTAPNRPTAP